MARVLVFGTFDLLHPGHLTLLNEAARHGRVTVSLTTDELCQHYKGHGPKFSFVRRRQRLEQLLCVDEVIPSDEIPASYTVLKRVLPTTIVLGYDQAPLVPKLRERLSFFGLKSRVVVSASYRANLYHSSLLAKISGPSAT